MHTSSLQSINFSKVRESVSWNNSRQKESLMHQIHVYPAKFPSFLVKKTINYIETEKNATIKTVGDIFCGCGTTALEARLNSKNFWGCDINPVATLISKTKRNSFKNEKIACYRDSILKQYEKKKIPTKSVLNNERINYWFDTEQVVDLYNLLSSIKKVVPKGKYQDFFLVGFSNILKRTSKWLTKSIKPTIDKSKTPPAVLSVFKSQIKAMIKANENNSKNIAPLVESRIENKNFLSLRNRKPFLDLLITSPPYVTSYEYADLHQLSTLWLGYVKDYKELRAGTIGSVYQTTILSKRKKELNSVGQEIYEELLKSKARYKTSVLKYFLDMKKTVDKSFQIVKKNGYAVFVIGNTKYKGVSINNAQYLAQCMTEAGFEKPEVKKRKISSKKLTPYRNSSGKFSTDKRHRKVYSYEYILIAKKS